MKRAPLLFLNVFVIATCGLIYELLAGTLSSYVLGDSVTQFSIIIGIYLFAMGVGSWLSRFIDKHVAEKFVEIELGVAVVGGFSAPLLFLSFAHLSYFSLVLYGIVFIIGVLVGLEIPLLMRILKDELDFKDLISRVLAFDYIGSSRRIAAVPDLSRSQIGLQSHVASVRNVQRRHRYLGNMASAAADQTERDFDPSQGCGHHPSSCDRVHQGRPTHHACRGCLVRRQHHLRPKLAVSTHRRHKGKDRLRPFSER